MNDNRNYCGNPKNCEPKTYCEKMTGQVLNPNGGTIV